MDAARFILDSPEGKAEGMKLLDGSHRAKLEVGLFTVDRHTAVRDVGTLATVRVNMVWPKYLYLTAFVESC